MKKTLFIDCGMGVAGDMLASALLDLFPDRDAVLAELNALGIPGVRYELSRKQKCGITGSHITVYVGDQVEDEDLIGGGHGHDHGHDHDHHHNHEHDHDHHHDHEHDHDHDHHHDHEHDHDHEHPHDHEHDHDHDHHHDHDHDAGSFEHTHDGHAHTHSHAHYGMHDIEHIVWDLHLEKKVEENVLAVYQIIAGAESEVHGVPMNQIHFHEVGTMDAIADITAVCYLMNKLAPDLVVTSPIQVGCGEVRCAHGILPVPAPATARILKGIPIYSDGTRGEMATPTGAALVRYFSTRFGSLPLMAVSETGYGMGTKDFGKADCVRVLFGEEFKG